MHKNSTLFLGSIFLLCVFLVACSSVDKSQFGSDALIAVAAVRSDEQGVLQFFQSTADGVVSAANLPAPGYPLGGKWSPDGRFFAFILIRSMNDIDIYRLDIASKELTRLTNTPTCPEIGLSWSLDGMRIHYAGFCRDGSLVTTFYTMALDGAQQTKLGDASAEAAWVVFSPDLAKAALISNISHGSAIHIAGVNGSNLTTLTEDGSAGYLGQSSTILDWSPDSSMLVYATHPITVGLASANQLIITSPDGAARRVLVQPPAGLQCHFPRWSPDNSQILFTCGPDLMTIRLDGSGLANLSNAVQGRMVENPIWIEGGKGIAFLSSLEPGLRKVERMQEKGLMRTTLGEIQASGFYGLAWQPVTAGIAVINSTGIPASSTSGVNGSTGINDPVTNPGGPTFDAENLIPWLIVGWLIVMLALGGLFVYRAILKSALRLPDFWGQLRSSEQQRQSRRAARRTNSAIETGPKNVQQAGRPPKKTGVQSDVEHQQQKVDQAIQSVASDGSYSVDPAEALLQDGIARARAGDASGAMGVLRAYLDQYPEDSMAWLWLGFASGLRNDWRGAESCFRRAGKLGNPQYDEALIWLEEQKKLLGSTTSR